VICGTRDFGIGRRVNAQNWAALRAVGQQADQRLCDVQAADAPPAPDVVTLAAVTRPSTIDDQHAPALRFGDPRVMALMSAVVGFSQLLPGFDNRTLTGLMATLLDAPYSSRRHLRPAPAPPRTVHRTPAAQPPLPADPVRRHVSTMGCVMPPSAIWHVRTPRVTWCQPLIGVIDSARSTNRSSAKSDAAPDVRRPTHGRKLARGFARIPAVGGSAVSAQHRPDGRTRLHQRRPHPR
jgi:hypothetical protein